MLETYYAKQVPKEARGIFFSYYFLSANIGRLICFGMGEILFKLSNFWTFVFIGLSCLLTGLMLIVLFAMGYYESKVGKARRSTIIEEIIKE